MPHWTALTTLLAVALYFWVGLQVARARRKYGIAAPATTGDPVFERTFRAQQNILEWAPIFLPALWLSAFYVSDRFAAAVGAVWVASRLIYAIGYIAAPEKRSLGFLLQLLCVLALFAAALVGVARALMG